MGERVVHIEFPAQDLERGKQFWEGVGGWTLNDAGLPGIQGNEFSLFQSDENAPPPQQ